MPLPMADNAEAMHLNQPISEPSPQLEADSSQLGGRGQAAQLPHGVSACTGADTECRRDQGRRHNLDMLLRFGTAVQQLARRLLLHERAALQHWLDVAASHRVLKQARYRSPWYFHSRVNGWSLTWHAIHCCFTGRPTLRPGANPAVLVIDTQNILHKISDLTSVACFTLLGHLGIHPPPAGEEEFSRDCDIPQSPPQPSTPPGFDMPPPSTPSSSSGHDTLPSSPLFPALGPHGYPASNGQAWQRTFVAMLALGDMKFIANSKLSGDFLRKLQLFENEASTQDVAAATAHGNQRTGWDAALLRAAVMVAMSHFDKEASKLTGGQLLFQDATCSMQHRLQPAALKERLQAFFWCATPYL